MSHDHKNDSIFAFGGEQADRENKLSAAVTRFGNNGSVDFVGFENVLHSLGSVDEAKIRQWKQHFSAQGKVRLTTNDLRSVIGLPTREEVTFVQSEQMIQAQRIRELEIENLRVQQLEIERLRLEEDRRLQVQSVIVQRPPQVRYQAAPVQSFVETRGYNTVYDEIGRPPVVEDYLLIPVTQSTGGFSDHYNSANSILKEIEALELAQEQRIRVVLQGFNVSGAINPNMDILHRLVEYCKALRSELNGCANHDYNLQNQYDQLVAYIIQYQNWEIYVKGLKNYWNELQAALNELNMYKIKNQQLTDENKMLSNTCQIQGEKIVVLEQNIRDLEQKVRIIPFLQKIIIDQAFEIIQIKQDLSGAIQDLSGLHGHYQGLFAQISEVGRNQGSYTKQQRLVVKSLRAACQQVIESACSASKNSLTGQDSLDRSQARAVAQCILELDIDIHRLTGDHIASYYNSNVFDVQWNKYVGMNGQLVGRVNIMQFFDHVIEHKSQEGKVIDERVYLYEQPPQVQI